MLAVMLVFAPRHKLGLNTLTSSMVGSDKTVIVIFVVYEQVENTSYCVVTVGLAVMISPMLLLNV